MIRTRTRSRVAKTTAPQSNPVLFEYPPVIFTRHDQQHIAPGQFLNDTIISFFMQYHLDNHVDHDLKQRIHILNSFFFAKIKSVDEKSETFGNASRWLKNVRIFDKDFLIMPVCENEHWILIIVCHPANSPQPNANKIPDHELQEPAIIVLNSCLGLAPAVKKSLSRFLKFQWHQERMEERSFSINQAKKSGIRLIFPDLPQQRNNYDCGVYILCYFYCFLKDPRSAYIKMFRRRSLRDWFKDNNIDIGRERRKMRAVIDGQIKSWREIHNETHNAPLSISPIVSQSDGSMDQNDSVIVIH